MVSWVYNITTVAALCEYPYAFRHRFGEEEIKEVFRWIPEEAEKAAVSKSRVCRQNANQDERKPEKTYQESNSAGSEEVRQATDGGSQRRS